MGWLDGAGMATCCMGEDRGGGGKGGGEGGRGGEVDGCVSVPVSECILVVLLRRRGGGREGGREAS